MHRHRHLCGRLETNTDPPTLPTEKRKLSWKQPASPSKDRDRARVVKIKEPHLRMRRKRRSGPRCKIRAVTTNAYNPRPRRTVSAHLRPNRAGAINGAQCNYRSQHDPIMARTFRSRLSPRIGLPNSCTQPTTPAHWIMGGGMCNINLGFRRRRCTAKSLIRRSRPVDLPPTCQSSIHIHIHILITAPLSIAPYTWRAGARRPVVNPPSSSPSTHLQ